jgi:RNA polymerase sigma-70 factor (ECF subfamily)
VLLLWRRPELYDRMRGSMMGWLLAIVRRRAIDRRRADLRRRRREERAALAEFPVPDDGGVTDSLERDRVARALAALPLPQREALALAFVGGFSQREVAQSLGIPLGTVKKRIALGLAKLRVQLAEESP